MFFNNQDEFEAFIQKQGKVLKGIEDYEESTLPPAGTNFSHLGACPPPTGESTIRRRLGPCRTAPGSVRSPTVTGDISVAKPSKWFAFFLAHGHASAFDRDATVGASPRWERRGPG